MNQRSDRFDVSNKNKDTTENLEIAGSPGLSAFLSPPSFWKPHYLGPSAWMEHAPFAFWATSVLRPRSIVELGTHFGFSYFAFCQAVMACGLETRCFAVDTWKGDEHAGLYGEEVFENVNRYNSQHYSSFSRLVRSTFEEALPHFPDASVDVLHIDGRHFYEDVRRDFESWVPKLSERAIVLFHDTNVRERGFGVFQFWAELADRFPSFQFFHGHGLGVLGYGPNVPETFLPLFESSVDQSSAVAVRSAYSRLGAAIQSDFDANVERSKLENALASIGSLRTQSESQIREIKKLTEAWEVLNDAYARLEGETHGRNTEIARLSNEWKLLSDAHEGSQRELESRNIEIVKLRTELEIRSADLSTLQRELNRANGESAKLRAELELRSAEVSALQGELERGNHETATLKAALETRDAEVSALQDELVTRAEKIALFESEVASLRSELELSTDEAVQLKQRMEAHYSQLENKYAVAKDISDAVQTDLEELRQKYTALKRLMSARIHELAVTLDGSSQRDLENVALNNNLLASRRSIAELEKSRDELILQITLSQDQARQWYAERTKFLERTRSLEAQLDARARAHEDAVLQLQAIYGSFWWKITGWLRSRNSNGALRAPVASLIENEVNEAAGLEYLSPLDRGRIRAAFDETYYLENYSDVKESGIDPFDHYMRSGWREGRDPSADFCTNFYLSNAPDIAEIGSNPFVHWVLHGMDENRRALPTPQDVDDTSGFDDLSPANAKRVRSAFDEVYYLEKYRDVADSGVDPFEHYMRFGWREGRDPSAEFCTSLYLLHSPDIAKTGTNPFTHWVLYGADEHRIAVAIQNREYHTSDGLESESLSPSDLERIRCAFDEVYYGERYVDVQGTGTQLFEHYMRYGWREGRDPSDEFCTSFYLLNSPDVAKGGGNPFVHWILHGIDEGRRALPPRNPTVAVSGSYGLEELSPEEVERVRSAFDEAYYLKKYADIGTDVDAFAHYIQIGWREGRDPSAEFCTSFYLLNSPDIAESGHNPFVHWVLHGVGEQRLALPSNDLERAVSGTSGLEHLSPNEVERVRGAFDEAYYRQKYSDLGTVDAFDHYLRIGWREGRDPSSEFCTSFYLLNAPDIAQGGGNPFVHWVLYGKNEKRGALPFRHRIMRTKYTPKVAAIIPNYNHARFLPRRIESVLNQTYTNLNVLILDDCSSDESRQLIERYCQLYPDRIRAIFNEKNSGGVFKQWRKGIDNTDGDIVWICESDDFCEADFLEKLIPYFCDESILLAFGRVQETDSAGNIGTHLDDFREAAEVGIWKEPLVRPARQWFANALGVSNVIANVGGCIWRRTAISETIWQTAQSYSVVGDWYLYSQIAGGGQIAWEPEAVSYFRRVETSASATSFVRPAFYQELERFMLNLRRQWDVPDTTVERFYSKVVFQYHTSFDLADKLGPLEQYCSKQRILAQQRQRPHILMSMYGFIFGGGEVFPVALANYIHAQGGLVSVLTFAEEANAEMRAGLNSAIPVYDYAWVSEYGADRFIAEAGISLIHSHTLGSELWFFEYWNIKTKIPYLVTLHGSYEATDPAHLPDQRIARLVRGVSQFVYTADKNLEPFRRLKLSASLFTKLPNAMPIDPLPFPKTREDLGIPQDAVVYTLVARGIPEKGWAPSIAAFLRVREKHPQRAMHLLLCGEGEEPDRLLGIHGADAGISFLGYQSRIHGLYRISDVAIVPSRFSGESFPLCIIQALQIGTPVVASLVGEIKNMIAPAGDKAAGILIEPSADDEVFVGSLARAMEAMLSSTARKKYRMAARKLGSRYNMDAMGRVYCDLYDHLLGDEGLCSVGENGVGLDTESALTRT